MTVSINSAEISVRLTACLRLVEILQQISKDLASLQPAALRSMRPARTFIDGLFAFLNENLAHSHQLIPLENRVTVVNFARFVR